MVVVTGHMVYFSAYACSEILQKNSRELGVGCESLRHTHVFMPKIIQILNLNPSKRNKSTSFYRSRSLLVASLSGGVHEGCLVYVSINFEWLPWNCKHSCSVHTTLDKFETDVNHSENTSNVFRPHFVGEIWKLNNHQSFWICVWGNRNIIVLEKLPFWKCFPSTLKHKAGNVFVWRASVFMAN